ncbi:hypothetical protein GQ457_12G005350 [Hibiscus cannabinus]
MATTSFLSSTAIFFISLSVISLLPSAYSADFSVGYKESAVPKSDLDLLEFPLNLEYLEAEFFLFGALGYGLDKVEPSLAEGGPSPIGGKKANLDTVTGDIILQFAYQEVGHLKAIKKTVKGFPRPQLDLSASLFAKVIDKAFGKPLNPPFDPYANSINFLIASYLIPYVGLTGYVGANPKLQAGCRSPRSRIRPGCCHQTLLYEHATENVSPYQIVVAEFTNRISDLRNKLGHTDSKDEGLIVPVDFGAEGKVVGNVLAGDEFSVAFDRTPEEILRIVYGTGNESIPGGFFPKGANGNIAKSHLQNFSVGYNESAVPKSDLDLLEFPLNLEYLEAEFFLFGALGYGLDKVEPSLAEGGPSPIGGKKANLDTVTGDIILQFAYQEVGHLKAIKKTVKGFPRPQLDLTLESSFDPYANSINFLIASYLIPYVGLTGYVGANPKLQGLLGVESGQDAIIRALLYQHLAENVSPYQLNVAEFANVITNLRNDLGHTDSDEGLIVSVDFGAEGKVVGNVLAGDKFSLAFDRTPEEILRIVYGTGNESIPGGFFPKGANGNIAKSHLQSAKLYN